MPTTRNPSTNMELSMKIKTFIYSCSIITFRFNSFRNFIRLVSNRCDVNTRHLQHFSPKNNRMKIIHGPIVRSASIFGMRTIMRTNWFAYAIIIWPFYPFVLFIFLWNELFGFVCALLCILRPLSLVYHKHASDCCSNEILMSDFINNINNCFCLSSMHQVHSVLTLLFFQFFSAHSWSAQIFDE